MKNNVLPLFAGRHDWLIMIALLVISLLAWIAHNCSGSAGFSGACKIKIFTDPVQEMYFAGPQAQPVEIMGKTGPTVIEWGRDGRIRIVSSTCPCKTCVNMGWTDGSSLVCVPNGVLVEPLADTGIDAVSR